MSGEYFRGVVMTSRTSIGGRGTAARKAFLISTSAAAIIAAGFCIAEPAIAQNANSGASTLPPVQVDAPSAPRVRRAQPQRAASGRVARTRPVAPQPVRQPLSVNNQDAQSGQVGYITRNISSGTKTNTRSSTCRNRSRC
jgi:catecholate siderophore receptor